MMVYHVRNPYYTGIILTTLALLVLALIGLAGCGSSDFINRAKDEGITVHHEDTAREVVGELCTNMDGGMNPIAAVFAMVPERVGDPAMSTNDERLIQLGIEDKCDEHSEAWATAGSEFEASFGGLVPAPEPAPVELAFGAEHIFSDGVKLIVSKPVPYRRTADDLEHAFQEGGPQSGARVTVTITNGSQADIDPSTMFGTATLNGQPIEGLAFAPAPVGELQDPGYSLLPGQKQTFDELFWIPQPGDLVITYSHGGGGVSGPLETVHYRTNVTSDVVSEKSSVSGGATGAPAPGPAPGTAEETNPDLNVGPDGYCTATPCGSNGQMPELTCTELGLPEDQCAPDGTYTP